MRLDNLPFNWFDVLTVLLLVLGVTRGRKRGMSQEVFTVLLWASIVVGCSAAYQPLGGWLCSVSPFSLLWSYITCYLILAGLIAILFVMFKRALGGKIIGSDTFGKAEYYLGMPAGMLRFACILITLLALLNARYYTTKEIKARHAYQMDVYGSEFFPGLSTIQEDVFTRSFIGPYIKKYGEFLLITPTEPQNKSLRNTRQASLP